MYRVADEQVENTIEHPQPTVLATILTFSSPDTLACTLKALGEQSRLPDGVLILDNAGTPPAVSVVGAWERPPELEVTLLREAENSGPAGGWARVLEEFLRTPFDLVWILDDDISAPPDSLALLLEEYQRMGNRGCLIPSVRTPSGLITNYPGWVGVLLAREVVESAGLPRADFFWWAEDFEYLMLRIPASGHEMRVTDQVVVDHQWGRRQWGNPPWKYYYETRNSVYLHLYIKHGRGRWPRKLAGLTTRAVLRENEGRVLKLRMIGRGVIDGVCRRLGRRVDPAA